MAKKPVPKKPAKSEPRAAAGTPALHALVIGVDFYLPNELAGEFYPSLAGCVSDATHVRDYLQARVKQSGGTMTFLTSTSNKAGDKPVEKDNLPSYANIVAGFKQLAAAKAGDHVHIHYSGHGGRCPTMVPEQKGKDGLDETLVPYDIGNKETRYVRDVHIAKFLADLTAAGLVVTAVFDSCHSGGVTRAARKATDKDKVGVRGVDFVDKTPRPADPDLDRPAARGGTARGLAPANIDTTQCVVLAACRPFESAYETTFDAGPSQGALTYWFLKLAASPQGLTFRTVYDQLLRRIHDQFPQQTPMLIGNPDRLVFGRDVLPIAPTVAVSAVNGQTVTLDAGQASLVQVGEDFAIYPQGVQDVPDPAGRIAVARVSGVQAASATAEVTSTLSKTRSVKPGDRAVAVGTPLSLVRKVLVVRPDGKPPAKADAALQKVITALADQSWVVPAKPGEDHHFEVTTDAKGAAYVIADASRTTLTLRPDLPTQDAASAGKVIDRLAHLARFQAVKALDNPDPAAWMKGKVKVDLLKTPAGFQRGNPTADLKAYPAADVPQLKPDAWVVLRVTNGWSRPINFVVLDLASDWSVAVAHPGDKFLTVNPGEACDLPLQAGLPPGQTAGGDVLKVIVTADPPPGYEVLTLPAADVPVPAADKRGGVTRGGGSPLGELLKAAGADAPTRTVSTNLGGANAATGWFVLQREVKVG